MCDLRHILSPRLALHPPRRVARMLQDPPSWKLPQSQQKCIFFIHTLVPSLPKSRAYISPVKDTLLVPGRKEHSYYLRWGADTEMSLLYK